MIKRLFDIILALFGLIVLSPIGIFIALFVYLYDRGPVFFKQTRIGLYQRPFTIYKFRSMFQNGSSSISKFEAGDKSRVTPVGKVLRKTKLDELPQLFNVFKGDMSFVGPRPEIREWIDVYPQKWELILKVKPGITDKAAIRYRNEEEILAGTTNPDEYYKNIILPEKINIYLEYVNNHSFTGDLLIILRTFFTILKK